MFNKEKKIHEREGIDSSNIVGQGTSVEGNIDTVGNIRIEGKVIGKITTKAKLVLGNTAFVEGDIASKNCEISGQVTGNLQVGELLILKSTAVIIGDIFTGKLIFEEGAQFNGKCQMPPNKTVTMISTSASKGLSTDLEERG